MTPVAAATGAWALVAVVIATAGASAGLALLVRAAPWSTARQGRKPLSCPVCTGLWASAAITLAWAAPQLCWCAAEVVLTWLCALTAAALAHRFVFPPPIEIPDDEEANRG